MAADQSVSEIDGSILKTVHQETGRRGMLERMRDNVDVRLPAEGAWEVRSAVSTTRFLYLTPGTSSLPPGCLAWLEQ